MTLLRVFFFSQTHTQLCCFHPLGVYTNPPPPFPPFLLTLNQSPKEIAGSDITNCLTHTMYAKAFKVACEVCRHWKFELILRKSCRDISRLSKDYLVNALLILFVTFFSNRWLHAWAEVCHISQSSKSVLIGFLSRCIGLGIIDHALFKLWVNNGCQRVSLSSCTQLYF